MIIVRLTRESLTSAKPEPACREGMALFESLLCQQNQVRTARGRKALPDTLRVRWNATHQLWLAWAYPAFSSWLTSQGLIPWIALSRANLANANLAGAYLADANLANANLAGANLANANLADANLAGAYLAGAYLANANLAGAYLPLGAVPAGWERTNGGYLRRGAR